MTFAKRLKILRLNHGLRQADICKAAKLSHGFYSDVENGKRSVSADTLRKMARVLGVTMDELFTGEGRLK